MCDNWTPQNTAHLGRCMWVGDRRGRAAEQILEAEKWSESVADFLL